jgi:protein-tyrosine phosphatase
MTNTRSVLFVCLGNIVRSPLAENLFRQMVSGTDLELRYTADSAGTSSYHAGEPPDQRMRRFAASRGVEVTGQSRQVTSEDLDRFDLIVAMDRSNLDALRAMARSSDQVEKMHLLRKFDPAAAPGAEVPDPWYGGPEGFQTTYEIVERSVRHLIETLRSGAL